MKGGRFKSTNEKLIPMKKGEKYKCQKCGLVVVIDSACACTACDLICCGLPLKSAKK